MNILQRMSGILEKHVNRDDLAGEEVVYVHEDANVSVTLKCLVMKHEELDTRTKTIISGILFSGLFLEIKPEKNDTIVYKNKTFKVGKTPIGIDYYDVVGYEKRIGVRR